MLKWSRSTSPLSFGAICGKRIQFVVNDVIYPSFRASERNMGRPECSKGSPPVKSTNLHPASLACLRFCITSSFFASIFGYSFHILQNTQRELHLLVM